MRRLGSRPSAARTGRRSFIIIAVLAIVGSALLVATSLLFFAQAEMAALASARRSAQSRALAWSGLQAVTVLLDEQRDGILEGELPEIDAQYTIYEHGDRLGIVRLLAVGPGGAHLVAEAGKLDLNGVEAEVLVATGLVDDAVARAIVAHRAGLGRPLQSVAELLDVEGVTPELLYGPLEDVRVIDAVAGAERDVTERVAERLGGAAPRGLADVVTVYSFEPALQRSGKLRINLNVPWSDDLARRVDERFGEGSSAVLKQIFDRGTQFDEEKRIFEVMRQFDTPPEDWPDIIDAITTDEGDYHHGRLDINTASYEALAALPGVGAEAAAEIVRTRDDLARDERATVAWPAIQKILPPEAYEQLAGRITTRSWTFRLRLAAGEVDAEEPDGAMANPVVCEAVIDLSAPRARVAYLRDVTMLQTAAALAARPLDDGLELYDEDLDDPAGEDDVFSRDDLDDEMDRLATADDIATLDDLAAPRDEEPFEDDGREDDGFDPGRWGDDPDDAPDEARTPVGPPVPTPGAATASADERTTTRRRLGRWRRGDDM